MLFCFRFHFANLPLHSDYVASAVILTCAFDVSKESLISLIQLDVHLHTAAAAAGTPRTQIYFT